MSTLPSLEWDDIGADTASADPPEDFDRWDATQPAQYGGEQPAMTARRVWYDDLAICERPAPTFLVDGLVPDVALGGVWGAPESGKTFLGLDLALSVSTGCACLGRDIVRGGASVFVVAEGASHFGRRIIAWKLAHGWPVGQSAGLHIHDGALDLTTDAAVVRFIGDTRALAPRLVIVDTLARCTPGADENSAREMGLVVQNLDRIKTELACTVLVLQHATKAGASERGSSVIRGAADFMFGLALVNDLRVLTPDKSKDFGLPDAVNLELADVPGADSKVMRLHGGTGAGVTPFEYAALRALRDSFPDGARMTELQTAAGLAERTAFRVGVRLVELSLAQKTGPIYRLTDYGRVVANRGRM